MPCWELCVTIHYVSKNKFRTFKIPIPPIQEQRNIAFILSSIQNAKEKTEAVISSLKELKKPLMNHLFTYGPISLENAEKAKLEETEIGKLCEGWEVVRLEEIAEITLGQSPKGDTYNTQGNGVPLINGPTEYGARHPHVIQWTTTPTKLCKNGDILFCVRGNTLGKLNIANAAYCIGRGVAAIRGKQKISDTMFLYYFLEMKAAEIYRSCIGLNSTFPNISGASLRKIAVSKPSLSVQQQIARILYYIDVKIETEEIRKEALNKLFESMLQYLMTAKIRVNNLGG